MFKIGFTKPKHQMLLTFSLAHTVSRLMKSELLSKKGGKFLDKESN